MGQRFCPLTAIKDASARGFGWDRGGERPIPVLIYRQGGSVYGYRNMCPHVGVPLEMLPDQFMSLDGLHLQCSLHGARFIPQTGMCIEGPCFGRPLRPVPLCVDEEGWVCATHD
jgi:nitrite reductase/ring-hydroxylating ferredoxin subunit